MILVGGFDWYYRKQIDTCEIWNLDSHNFKSMAPLPSKICFMGLSMPSQHDLFCFGGQNGQQPIDSIYQFNSQIDQWKKFEKDIPTPADKVYCSYFYYAQSILLFDSGDYFQKSYIFDF